MRRRSKSGPSPDRREVSERRKEFSTESGIPIERAYSSYPRAGLLQQTWVPGQYPFTRGVAAMYRTRFWTMRQYAVRYGGETNKRFRFLLIRDDHLSTAFDLPTQVGYDSDHC